MSTCRGVANPALPSFRNRAFCYLGFASIGALAFWVPDVIVHLFAGGNFGRFHVLVMTFLLPVTLLCAYVFTRSYAVRRGIKWAGPLMMLGVWMGGGVILVLSSIVTGAAPVNASVGSTLTFLGASLIPLVTFVMATYDSSLGALIIVTIASGLIWATRSD